MARKKAKDQSKLYTRSIRTRVTETIYTRLKSYVGNSDCHSIGEAARRILSREKIICFYQDNTMDITMEELVLIRKELNAIGVNINQITHHFHTSQTHHQKMFQALKVAQQYTKVGDKVDRLLELVSRIAKKWLQK